MSLATLFGKLQEHELELNRLIENEEMDKKKKGIALKAATSRSASVENDDTSSTSNGSEQDDDEMGLFVKKFGKFLKRNNRGKKAFPKKNGSNKKGDPKATPLTCYECGKPGHMKFECPTHQKKNDKGEKKGRFERKPRRAYVAWEDNDSGSSSSSDEEECAKLCLMAQDDESSSEVSDSNSNNPSYDDLYNGFIELHEETKKLTLIAIERKRTMLAMEQQMLNLQKKFDELKLENETLNLIYTNASCDCSSNKSSLLPCDYCKELKAENKDLWKTLAKFTMGRDNLNALLGKQTCMFQKAGIGYNPNKQKKAYKNFFTKSRPSSSPFAFCTYCGKKGHFAYACFIRNYGVPSGKYIWVPKEEGPKTNPKGSNKPWIPMTHK